MATIRTFIAIEVSDQIKKNVQRSIGRLAKTTDQYKWVESENLHLTLNFLGEVDERQTPDVCNAVSKVVANIEPFLISVRGGGAFPNIDRPRIIWMGIEDGLHELVELNRMITNEMLELRIPKDKHAYNPHLTLGRQKRGGRWNDQIKEEIRKLESVEAGSTLTREVVVYSSYLDRFGPSYTPMSRIKIK